MLQADWYGGNHVATQQPRRLLSEDLLHTPDEEGAIAAPVTVRVEGPPPKWLTQIIRALNELLSLPANWDSYGAHSIKLSSAVASLEFLTQYMDDATPIPAVVPTVSGDVQVEWHTETLDIEVRFGGRHCIEVLVEDLEQDNVEEFQLSSQTRDILEDALDRLGGLAG